MIIKAAYCRDCETNTEHREWATGEKCIECGLFTPKPYKKATPIPWYLGCVIFAVPFVLLVLFLIIVGKIFF